MECVNKDCKATKHFVVEVRNGGNTVVTKCEYCGWEQPEATNTQSPGGSALSACWTDTDLINTLEGLNKEASYTGKCILRQSTTGRGWRLHETSKEEGCDTVREAIIDFLQKSV